MGNLEGIYQQGTVVDKLCPKCKLVKSYLEFNPDRAPNNTDGLQGYCKECQKAYRRSWYNSHPNRLEWRNNADSKEVRRGCEKRRAAKTWALRLEMIAAYGGKCSCCGIIEPKFLTLEHLNGGGNAHRRQFPKTSFTWRDLKSKGWPQDGYTILCWCCQMAKTHFGRCPHQGAQNVAAA